MINVLKRNWREYFLLTTVFVTAYFYLSYRLTTIPPGINIDESSIGYNAALISRTGRDENNRRFPVFINTLDQQDWKQPSNVYFAALVFKLFGTSYYHLKVISVIYALLSGFLFYQMLRLYFRQPLSFIGLLLFFTTPSILIQSHLVLENIAMLPFFIGWIYLLLSATQKPKLYKYFLAGILLGLSFYSYKGMRALVPMHLLVVLGYLVFLSVKTADNRFANILASLKNRILPFVIGALPFLAMSWHLNTVYPRAVYDNNAFHWSSFFEMAKIFFGNFDFSFLFVTGDLMLIHSTGRHGIFLAVVFFLALIGFIRLVQQNKPDHYFFIILLLLTPLLLIPVGSVYRASRLLAYIPPILFLAVLGAEKIVSIKTTLTRTVLLFLFIIFWLYNFYDFAAYYYHGYPKRITADFSPNFDQAFKLLSQETTSQVFIEYSDYRVHQADMQFFSQVYFPDNQPLLFDRAVDILPTDGVLLTGLGNINNQTRIIKEIPSVESGQRTFFIIKPVSSP